MKMLLKNILIKQVKLKVLKLTKVEFKIKMDKMLSQLNKKRNKL